MDKLTIWSFSLVGPDDYRGGDGPLHVSCGKSNGNPLYQAFIDAGVQAGYPFTEDMNSYQQEGFGWMDKTIHKGVRWNTANAYLRPALKRKNLQTQTRALTLRILFENNRAVGVEYQLGNEIKRAGARKGVIIAAGAINTPQLLTFVRHWECCWFGKAWYSCEGSSSRCWLQSSGSYVCGFYAGM